MSEVELARTAGSNRVDQHQPFVELRVGPRRPGHRAIKWLKCFASNRPFAIAPDDGQLRARSEVLAQGSGGVSSGQAAGDTASLGGENVLEGVHEELQQRRGVFWAVRILAAAVRLDERDIAAAERTQSILLWFVLNPSRRAGPARAWAIRPPRRETVGPLRVSLSETPIDRQARRISFAGARSHADD